MKTNNPNAGFTLLEVVLSIGILAVISLPILSYFTESLRYSMMTAKQQQATFLAQEITEGLLAESRLITKVAEDEGTVDEEGDPVRYKVPYFEKVEGFIYDKTASDVRFRLTGEGSAVFTSTNRTDGYEVEVTITSENGPLDDLHDLGEYAIDPLTDVVYIDSTENNQAVFELMGAHYSYYQNHPDETPVEVDEDTVMKTMSRDIYIHLSKEIDALTSETDGYRVKIWYEYKCGEVHGVESDTTPGIWNWGWNGSYGDDKAVLLDKKVEELQNIYLVYQWCDGGDVVRVSADDNFDINIGLYIIYQPRNDDDEGPEINEQLRVRFENGASLHEKVTGYTNAGGGRVIQNGGISLPGLTFTGDAKASRMYEINTKIYSNRDVDHNDPLAEITAKKGE